MAPLAGQYELTRNENFVNYLTSIGIPQDTAQSTDALRPKLQVSVSGNNIMFSSNNGTKDYTITLIVGQEVEENFGNDIVYKSSSVLDGDTLTVRSKSKDGKIGTRVYKFTDSELILTLSAESGAEIAKRFYKRI